MPRVIVSGGPGAGKSTLIAELASRGFPTVAQRADHVLAVLGDARSRAGGLSA